MAAPTLTFAEKERPVEQTMTPEEQYGVIKAPDSPLMAKAAMMFRDVERSVEGSPAEFMLPGGGIATVLEKKAYGQEPTALDYGFAALDTADFVPGLGKMAIFAGAASASGVKKSANCWNVSRRVRRPNRYLQKQIPFALLYMVARSLRLTPARHL